MKLNLLLIKSAAPAALGCALVFASQSVAFGQHRGGSEGSRSSGSSRGRRFSASRSGRGQAFSGNASGGQSLSRQGSDQRSFRGGDPGFSGRHDGGTYYRSYGGRSIYFGFGGVYAYRPGCGYAYDPVYAYDPGYGYDPSYSYGPPPVPPPCREGAYDPKWKLDSQSKLRREPAAVSNGTA